MLTTVNRIESFPIKGQASVDIVFASIFKDTILV